MEQYPQIWMSNPSAKGTLMESNYVVASTSSWEEEAFAEDAAGRFGGLVWPPRSYRCNFCGREFRSAQALGGHMNVHRKEKARITNNINQQSSSIPQNKENNLGHNHHKNQCIRVNPSDYIKSTTNDPKEENEETLAPSSNSSIRFLNILGSKTEEECMNKKLKTVDELPVSLNLDIGIGKERMLLAGYKRRRFEEVPLPIVIKAAIDDLDLELRLGDRPKVK